MVKLNLFVLQNFNTLFHFILRNILLKILLHILLRHGEIALGV